MTRALLVLLLTASVAVAATIRVGPVTRTQLGAPTKAGTCTRCSDCGSGCGDPPPTGPGAFCCVEEVGKWTCGLGGSCSVTTTSTSTTTTTCPCAGNAPDWSSDSRFKGIWRFEESNPSASPPVVLWADSSPATNPLFPNGTSTTDAQEGCRAVLSQNVGWRNICRVEDGCTTADFEYTGPWTEGCWEKPTDCEGTCIGYTIVTDHNSGDLGAGYGQGWTQDSGGFGRFFFETDANTGPPPGGDEIEIQTGLYAAEAWHHHVVRWSGSQATQIIDGVAGTPGGGSQPTAWTLNSFQIGRDIPVSFLGQVDECFSFAATLSDEDVCRIAICGIRGCGCTCSGTTYVSRPKHASEGGPIDCNMPMACNKAAIDTTTTSTSTTSSTSTSTSTTSTTASTTSSTTVPGESSSFVYVPFGSFTESTGVVAVASTAGQMRCSDFVARRGISAATKMVVEVTTALDTGSSVHLYNADGSTLLATTGPQNWSSTGFKAVSGITAFNVAPATSYRLCWCATSSTGGAFRGSVNVASSTVRSWQEAIAVHQGLAANGCTSGVAPSTTGSLSTTTNFALMPLVGLGTNSP